MIMTVFGHSDHISHYHRRRRSFATLWTLDAVLPEKMASQVDYIVKNKKKGKRKENKSLSVFWDFHNSLV